MTSLSGTLTRSGAAIGTTGEFNCYHYNREIDENMGNVESSYNYNKTQQSVFANGRVLSQITYTPRKDPTETCVKASRNACYILSCLPFAIPEGVISSIICCFPSRRGDANTYEECVGQGLLDETCGLKPLSESVYSEKTSYEGFADCIGDRLSYPVRQMVRGAIDSLCSNKIRKFDYNAEEEKRLTINDLKILGLNLADNESKKQYMTLYKDQVFEYKGTRSLLFTMPSIKSSRMLFDRKGDGERIDVVVLCKKNGEMCGEKESQVKAKEYIDLILEDVVTTEPSSSTANSLLDPLLGEQ